MLDLNKCVKKVGFILTFSFIVIVVGALCFFILSFLPPDKDKMAEYFARDKNELILVAQYFENIDYSYIYIDKSRCEKGMMFTGPYTRDKEIEDTTVIKVLKDLLKNRGYHVVGRDGNTVFFQKYSVLGSERGITYSINGEDDPVVEFVVKLDKLEDDGWFYYEADYEEFRNG